MQWQWTKEPDQGVLVDDSGTVQRIVVVREPMIGEHPIGHVVVQGVGLAETWLETVDEARHYAEETLPVAVKATLVPS